MVKKYISIHEVPDDVEAHVVKGYLERAGIESVVHSARPDPSKPDQFISPSLMPKSIYVKKEDLSKARSAILKYKNANRHTL